MTVWVARLRPLQWYHRVEPTGETACGLPATRYGYFVPSGEALAWADSPCPRCFAPPLPTIRTRSTDPR